MTLRRDKRINNSEPLKIWFWSLVGVIVFCFFTYGFLVRGVIVNVVERQNMENELSALNSKVSALESVYIKAKNDITPELAGNIGFVTATKQEFVMREENKPGLSLLTSGL